MKITRLEENGIVWKLNDEIVNNWYYSLTRQIFDVVSTGKVYVWKTDELELRCIPFDSALRLMLKLDTLESTIT